MPEKPPPPKLSDIKDRSQLVRVGGHVDRNCVGLRLFGETLDPDEVTRLLGCQPTEARRKGDVIPDKRYHRVAQTGSWRLDAGLPETTAIEDQVISLLSKLTSDLQVWQRLSKELDVDIFCGLFLDDWNRGFGLSSEVMSLLAQRGIYIAFDIYASASDDS